MIFLNRGYFRPMCILWGLIFSPMIAMGIIWFIHDKSLEELMVTVLVAVIYFGCIFVTKKVSQSTKYYLICHFDHLEIKYPNLAKNNCLEFTIKNTDIIQFDYSKISSPKAWLLIPVYDLPQCVFMTYVENNAKKCKLIGYMRYGDIQRLAQMTHAKLVVH